MTLQTGERYTRRVSPFGVSLLAVGIVLLVFGIYWARYVGGGVLAFVILFTGLLLAIEEAGLERGGHQKLWVNRSVVSPGPEEVAPLGEQKTEIRNNTNDLVNRLGITGFQVEKVAWGPSADQIRNVASGECHFDHNELVLSSRLRSTLNVEDWTPLIAVSLIYDKKLMPRIFRTRRLFAILWVLSLAGLGVLMSLPGNSIIALPYLLWLFAPLVIGIRLAGGTDFRMRLLANSEAGDLVGRDRLAGVLAKIGEKQPEPVPGLEEYDRVPTISERLNRIEPVGSEFQDPQVRRVKGSLQVQQNALTKTALQKRHTRLLFALIFLICLLVPTIAFLVWDNSVCPRITVIPAGTQIVVGPVSHSDYPFFVSNVIWDSRSMWGAFTATQPVTMYIMTASQFGSFNTTGTIGSYLFSSGLVSSATYECGGRGCPSEPFAHQGQEYVTIYNPNGLPSTITITQDMYVGGC